MKSFAIIIGESIPEALKVHSIPLPETIREASLVLGMRFGPQLSEYLLTYGAIAFGTVEFNGITEAKRNNSSLIRNTVFLRDAFPGKLSRTFTSNSVILFVNLFFYFPQFFFSAPF